MAPSRKIIDTFPSFLQAVETCQPENVSDWLACWTERYMVQWPVLFEMQVADYAEEGEDWQQIAQELVFPNMTGKLPDMMQVYQDLSPIIEPIEDRARRKLGFSSPVTYILYVGIGNGAGWVTTYEGSPAVLFGLEGIVDSGFNAPEILEGLVAHELGHVVHFAEREPANLMPGSGPWWQLYEEGFAQRCEHEILERPSWHMRAAAPADGWLTWCRENRSWLAVEFLRVIDAGESVRPFFGSWYDIDGHKQTGYYLGHEVISCLAKTMSMRDIALIEAGQPLQHILRQVVTQLATEAA